MVDLLKMLETLISYCNEAHSLVTDWLVDESDETLKKLENKLTEYEDFCENL